MKTIFKIREALESRIREDGITAVIKALKQLLSEQSSKYTRLLRIEEEHDAICLKMIEEAHLKKSFSREIYNIRKELLELIRRVDFPDYKDIFKHSYIFESRKTTTWRVQYLLLNSFKINYETPCVVRLFAEGVSISDDLGVKKPEGERLKLHISKQIGMFPESMGASAFKIRGESDSVQLIDEKLINDEDALEWIFHITPLMSGEHLLELKLRVVEVFNKFEWAEEKIFSQRVFVSKHQLGAIEDEWQNTDIVFETTEIFYLYKKVEQPPFKKERDVEKKNTTSRPLSFNKFSFSPKFSDYYYSLPYTDKLNLLKLIKRYGLKYKDVKNLSIEEFKIILVGEQKRYYKNLFGGEVQTRAMALMADDDIEMRATTSDGEENTPEQEKSHKKDLEASDDDNDALEL